MTKKTRTRLKSTEVKNPRTVGATLRGRPHVGANTPSPQPTEEGAQPKRNFRDVYGIHLPQICAQGRAGPLRVSEIIAAVRYLHAVDAVHSSDETTDADRLLIVLDGLPRLLAALSGVHEDIWAGATIDDAIEAATQYFQTRFKDTDIRAELDRLEDTLNDMVDRLAAMRVTVFGE